MHKLEVHIFVEYVHLTMVHILRYTVHSGGESRNCGAAWVAERWRRMAIRYDKLFALLKEKGYTSYRIRKEKLIGQATLQKFRSGEGIIDTRTIEKLCKLLQCQPGDIMEYVEEEK